MKKNQTLIIVLVAVGVLVVAGIAALLVPSDSDGTTGEVTTVDPIDAPPAVGETLPVEVVGTPLPALEDPTADPAIGESMPVISGRRFDGSDITIGGPTEGPTMYVFLAHWCPHCNDEIPELLDLRASGGIPEGLDVVGISTAVAADRDNYPPSEWIVEKNWPWPVMADDETATAFVVSGGSAFPYTVLTDADGNVIARADGSRPADVIGRWLADNLSTA